MLYNRCCARQVASAACGVHWRYEGSKNVAVGDGFLQSMKMEAPQMTPMRYASQPLHCLEMMNPCHSQMSRT